MPKIQLHPIKIHKYFPPNDDLAVKIVNMCIVVEDFFLESEGYIAEAIPVLDDNSAEWRQLYFLRNVVGTSHELKNVIERIQMDKCFQGFLAKQESSEKNRYAKLYRDFNKQHERLKNIRNQIGGGHVQKKAVKEGLERIDPFEEGFMQIGKKTRQKTHYKFVLNIVKNSLSSEFLSNSQDSLEDIFSKVVKAMMSGQELSDRIFAIYIRGKDLVPNL